MEGLGIAVWVDGGWAADALLCRQTRPHSDLDIVLEAHHVERAVAHLRANGYEDVPRPDTRPCNFVLGHREGYLIDFHVVVFDSAGNGVYGPPENGDAYPAQAFTGRGEIGGHPVRCMSLDHQLTNHDGYPVRACDWHDMRFLCTHFGRKLPERFRGGE